MPPLPIILDTDPGQDDAVALLLALAAPDQLDLRAVTTIYGNVPLALTQRNARALVELAGRHDVPVFAGCERPLLRPLRTAEFIVGPTGLDGAGLPEPTLPLGERHAADALIALLMAAPEDGITLCPVGPMTNVATALAKEPRIVEGISRIVMMGGCMGIGNVSPVSEFNFHCDPHAAAMVFACGAPIVMFGLDATHQVISTRARIEAFAAMGTRTGRAVAGMLGRETKRNLARFHHQGAPLHDPCVIAYLLWPELFHGKPCHVAIETGSELTQGQSVVDWWGVTGKPPNATVIDRVDAEGLFERMTAAIARLP